MQYTDGLDLAGTALLLLSLPSRVAQRHEARAWPRPEYDAGKLTQVFTEDFPLEVPEMRFQAAMAKFARSIGGQYRKGRITLDVPPHDLTVLYSKWYEGGPRVAFMVYPTRLGNRSKMYRMFEGPVKGSKRLFQNFVTWLGVIGSAIQQHASGASPMADRIRRLTPPGIRLASVRVVASRFMLKASKFTPKDMEWLNTLSTKSRPTTVNMEELVSVLSKIDLFDLKPTTSFVPLSTEDYGDGLYDLSSKIEKAGKGLLNVSYPRGNRGNVWQLGYAYTDDQADQAWLRRVEEYAKKAGIVFVSGKPSGQPKHMQVYASKLKTEKGSYEGQVRAVAQMWIGMDGWILTTPKGKTALALPLEGRGRNAKPANPKAISNKHFLKRLYMALYGGQVHKAVKLLLEGKEVRVDPRKPGEVVQHRERSPEIEKVLRQITDKKYNQVVKGWENTFLEFAEEYRKALEKDPTTDTSAFFYMTKRKPQGLFYSTLSKMTQRTGVMDYELKSDYKTIARNQAKALADEAREQFIWKNSAKLGAIANKKKNFKDAKVLKLLPGNDYGGEIKFTFADGSEFMVRNKTVTKVNFQGTVYFQYPTTFHNVVLPNGKKMPSPSEKRMQDVFTVA